MVYTTPPMFADDDNLTATQLNILSNDIEYLAGIVISGINVPFASQRRPTNFAEANNRYLTQHLNRYLHHFAHVYGGTNDDLDVFYDGVRVYHDGTTRSAVYAYSGYTDLDDPESWSDWIGAYDGGTSYNEHDVVSSGGVYYASLQNGNSGNAVSNATYWRNLGAAGAFVTAGNYYYLYVTTNLSGSPDFVLDYLLESSETTL